MPAPAEPLRNDNKRSISKVLLEEYKICSSRADKITTLVWTLATALLSLNAGGLILVGQIFLKSYSDNLFDNSYLPPLILSTFISLIIASAATFLLQWWNRVANRWNCYQVVWYHRMQEIEAFEEFPMWANRDLEILDKKMKGRDLSEIEADRFKVIKESTWDKYLLFSGDSIRKLRNSLIKAAAVAWLVLIWMEIIITAFNIGKSGVIDPKNILILSFFGSLVILALILTFWIWRITNLPGKK